MSEESKPYVVKSHDIRLDSDYVIWVHDVKQLSLIHILIACFDNDVTEETVKAVAEKKPYYSTFLTVSGLIDANIWSKRCV